jgi:hypothetical protein
MNDDLRQRVALRALALSLRIKPDYVGSLTGHIRQSFVTGAISDADLDNWLLRSKKEMASHFEADLRVSASQRLENANAAIAEQRATNKSAAEAEKPKVTLNAREAALPVNLRAQIYEEKLAAAIAAQKKQVAA